MNHKILFYSLTTLDVILMLISIPCVMMSPMIFDAPGSENSALVISIFIFMLCIPLTTFVALVVSSIYLLKTKNFKKACLGYLLPALNITLLVIACWLLQVMCNGQFVCF